MAPIKVLLANEAGGGRGHIVKLAAMVRAIAACQTDAQFTAGLARHRYAQELTSLGVKTLSGPELAFTAAAAADPLVEGNATWGDYLFAMGLARPDLVRQGIAWWQKTIVAEDASLLVTDYAPLAMLAARGLRAQGWQIEVASVGTGYGVPPADMADFPQLLPDHARRVHHEPAVLAQLNTVMEEFDFPPLPSLPAIYDVALPLPCTLPFLDPYQKFRAPEALLPPQMDRSPSLATDGQEVFIYFSTKELADPEVVAALEILPLPCFGYLPGTKAATAARLAAAGVQISERPLSVAEITARSRLVLHSAQHGSICLAAFAGLPQMALPQHLEQVFHGRRAGQQGILDQLEQRHRSKDAILDIVQSLYHDRQIATRAQDFARQLRSQTPKDCRAILQDRLAPVLADLHQ